MYNISIDYWTANTEKCTRLEQVFANSKTRSEYYIQARKNSELKDKILLL